MGTIIITGVPGVGKTTVVTEAARLAGLPVVVYGSAMVELARAQGLVRDRDEMRRLPSDVQRRLQEAAAQAIAEQGRVIVDTHATIQTPKGYLPGIPSWVAERLSPEMIVIVEAPPEAIEARRAFDATRKRDSDTEEAISAHQDLNRAAMMAVGVLTGATVLIVQNEEGQPGEAAAVIAAALR